MENTNNRKFNNVLFFTLKKLCIPVILFLILGGILYAQTSVTPVLSLDASGIVDQDDMCIWIHPTNKSQSTIITSDKGADKLFVYDLDGNTLQTIDVPGMPGNIDIRYNFNISGEPTDIVGYNDRSNNTIVFYKVDHSTRQLSFISSFEAGSNYGFCLYRSFITGKYYAFSSNQSSRIRQFELSGSTGIITGVQVREWYNGNNNTEGLVADDELAKFYAANEAEGIYKYDAEPNDPNPTGELIAPTGVNGFSADVEGITIYYAANGEGYLIASSQGNSRFYVFNRKVPHDYVNYFTLSGVGSTDGIDITNVSLNSTFQAGIFLSHDGTGSPYTIRGCRYEDLGLLIDTTYWNPRIDVTPPSLLAAEINNPTQVTLFFSESLDSQSAQDENNYSIDNEIIVISAVLNSNNKDVTLTTSEHTIMQQYTVTVSNVTDLAGNTINPDANSAQYFFEVDITPPEVLGATILDSVTLKISFSELLESSTAQNPNNYSITNGISVFSASLSGSEVILNTSSHSPGIYTVTVSNVTDLAGNIISSSANSAQYEFVQDPTNELTQLQIVDVTASVTPEPEHSPEKTIDGLVYGDGDPDSRWAGDTMPEWLTFDLGIVKEVSLSKLSFYNWNNGRIYNYSISVSNDMNQWTEVVSPSLSSSEEWTINEFQPINARYIKIDFINSNQSTWAGLWEGELWGNTRTSVDIEEIIPEGFKLEQNYPNPFNPVTTIIYLIPEKTEVSLKIFNSLGEEVSTLVNEEKPAGVYEVEFSATGGNAYSLPSGIYFYALKAGSYTETKKMILMK